MEFIRYNLALLLLLSLRRSYNQQVVVTGKVLSTKVIFVWNVLIIILIDSYSYYYNYYNSTTTIAMVYKEEMVIHNTSSRNIPPQVPFFYVRCSQEKFLLTEADVILPPFHELRRSLEGYRTDVARLLYQLERAILLSEESERFLTTASSSTTKMADILRDKLAQLASILESDGFTLETLLQPFPFTVAIADSSTASEATKPSKGSINEPNVRKSEEREDEIPLSEVKEGEGAHSSSTRWVLKTRRRVNDHPSSSELSYSSAKSVIAHITRDWTHLGDKIRQSYYGWLLREVLSHPWNNTKDTKKGRILVPGAGLGRLAKEIASVGYSVEANDCSIVMAAVAYQILHHRHHHHADEIQGTTQIQQTATITIHPFATDPFVNEVNSSLRFQEVAIHGNDEPLVQRIMDDDDEKKNPLQDTILGSMSYTVGDFVSVYSSPQRRSYFDSIVTCFFLDTATNIYEYIATIRHVLKPHGGVWINLGPVQWHENALLQPSVDELRLLIQDVFHFHISFWQVDSEAMNYRSSHGNDAFDLHTTTFSSSSTRFEGYKPLRFVATTYILDGEEDQLTENTLDCINSLRKTFDHMSYSN
jgi:hypothetical protein